jgi:UDP-3-O-[3-hydroxymyristoyl] N-acetylglucosamine deacetylase
VILQRSIKDSVSATGVGLHSGKKVKLTLKPAPENHGIVFCRTDLKTPMKIKVDPTIVQDTKLCSAIGTEEFKVATVEHLMSALSALGIDNILIEVNGPELPIMDGSSISFIYLIKSAGIIDQTLPKQFVFIKEAIEVNDGDKSARFDPHPGFLIDFTIDFPHPAFKDDDSHVVIDFFKDSYVSEISRARTFGFMHEVEFLRANGLARGGSLDNAIVLDESKIINDDGLRYTDEFVRHKILDAMGDLYLLGKPIIGKFTAYKSGHELNNRLLRKLAEETDKWEMKPMDANDPITSDLAQSYLKMSEIISEVPEVIEA